MALSLDPAELRRFVTLTEAKILPKQVGKLYARAEMLAKLPLPVQRLLTLRRSTSTGAARAIPRHWMTGRSVAA